MLKSCFFLLMFGVHSAHGQLWFQDVSKSSGLAQSHPSLKFGGPCVADIDGDGHYDLILSYHNDRLPQVYFGSANGTFSLSPFRTPIYDIHGVSVAPRTAYSRSKIVAISVGGGMGGNLRPPLICLVGADRKFKSITKKYGFGARSGRGRNTVFMDVAERNMKKRKTNLGGPDVVVVNFLGNPTRGLKQFAYQNIEGDFALRRIPGFENEVRGRVEVTDIDGDGMMELISIRNLKIFQLKNSFEFVDATEKFLPRNLHVGKLACTSVVELDFDNDGDFDLYITRAERHLTTHYKDLPSSYTDDILLENRNGIYIDVSEKAKIPKGGNSMGVTAGDFNNDGYVDLMVSVWSGSDFILLNKGNGEFERHFGFIPKPSWTVGNHANAIDINLDGRVDIIVGQGDARGTKKGLYFLMKNMMTLTKNNRFLLVRVHNEPGRSATSLHAVVHVFVGGLHMVQRVGSRGAQAGGSSYVDTVHFGLGSHYIVPLVRVKWTSGAMNEKRLVTADKMISFGVI